MTLSEWIQSSILRQWRALRERFLQEDAPELPASELALLAARTAPVVWLIGKVQAGKTSIVRALAGATAAEVGEGFRACTRSSVVFDFPAEAPVLRFLDTRGLGEAGYDPTDDIAFCEAKAHLLLVVMKAMDPSQEAVFDVARQVRERHPAWPVLVAQTTLHEGYRPGEGHISPYPYASPTSDLGANPAIPGDLVRALQFQRMRFDELSGPGALKFVAIDFTKPEDGFTPQNYGLEALLDALEEIAPAGVAAAFGAQRGESAHGLAAKASPHILGHAAAAAAADTVPAAGALAVPVIQARLLQTLGELYGSPFDRQTFIEFSAQLGISTLSRMLASFGLRQLAKLIPVYGQTAGAAGAALMSFATTFALGKAACFFLARRKLGQSDRDGVSRAYADALKEAFDVFRRKMQAA